MADTFVNFYEILNLSQHATEAEIKKAVQDQRRTWTKRQSHPDQDKRHQAEKIIKDLADAERTLLDAALRRAYDQQLATYRPSAPGAGAATSGSWLERAVSFLDGGDAQSANYAAREATTLEPQNDRAWAVRAESSLMLGHDKDAIFEFSEAVRLSPQDAGHHFDLGTVYESVGNWDQALRSFERASALEPGVLVHQLAIASVLLQSGRTSRGLEIMERLAGLEPQNETFNFYLAAALHDTAIDNMTAIRGGGVAITSEEQAKKVLELSQRGLGLRFTDTELRASLNEQLALAQKALKVSWYNPFGTLAGKATTTFRWYAAFRFLLPAVLFLLPFFIMGSNVGLGIGIAVPWYLLMWKVFWRPGWRINRAVFKGQY